jgi:peptide alpha-N-acetyltransferase
MYADALEVLEAGSAAKRLRDPLGVREQTARLLLALGRHQEAEETYRRLVASNTENYRYHEGLQAALRLPSAVANGTSGAAGEQQEAQQQGEQQEDQQQGQQRQQQQQRQQPLTEDQRARLAEVYSELQQAYPRSPAARRMPLDFLVSRQPAWAVSIRRLLCSPARSKRLAAVTTLFLHGIPSLSCVPLMQEGNAFLAAADAYVRRYLLRGIPSLFSGAVVWKGPGRSAALLRQGCVEPDAASIPEVPNTTRFELTRGNLSLHAAKPILQI